MGIKRLIGPAVGLLALLAVAFTVAPLAAPTPVSQAQGATRIVVDARGMEVTVPAQPKRIVALSEADLDSLLALGVKPVGTVQGRGQTGTPRYLGDRAAGIPIVGAINAPNIEAVLAAQPDLILAGNLADEQILAQLRLIAPTVVTFQTGEHWRTIFQRVAETVGKTAEAQAVLQAYEARLAEVRASLGERANAEVSIVRWNAQGPVYMLPGAFSSTVIADLGLRRPAHQQSGTGTGHSPTLSLEMLDLLDADWIFVGTLAAEGEAVAAMTQVMNTPAFQQLNAVKEGHITLVDGSLWSSAIGPIAAMAILDDVEKALGSR